MQRGDQKNHQTNYRKQFMSTKEQQNRAILANSSIGTYENGEMRHIQTKTSIWIHSWLNQFWNRIANVSVKKRRGIFISKAVPRLKKLNQNLMKLYSPGHWTKREIFTLSVIYVRKTFQHQVHDSGESRKFHFFSSLRRSETLFGHKQGHQRAGGWSESINTTQNWVLR